MAAAEYDIFLSHAWKDGDAPAADQRGTRAAGLRVWFDATEIDDFASITRAVTEGLAKSKALLAYYSATYPLRRACQWELTAAFLAAQTEGDPRRRVLVINPERRRRSHPSHRTARRQVPQRANTDAEMQQLVQAIVKHVGATQRPAGRHSSPHRAHLVRHDAGGLNPLRRTPERNVGGALAAVRRRCHADHGRSTVNIGQLRGWAEWASRCWRKSTRCISARPIPAASSGCVPTATMTRSLSLRLSHKACRQY